MFVIVSGSSGVGKNTVINRLLETDDRVKAMVTNTTRAMRVGEVDGVNYNFITMKEFDDKLKSGDICEWEEIHGNYYGSSLKDIMDTVASGKVLLKDLGVEGAVNMQKVLSNKVPVISIFLTAPKKELIKRLIGRGETQVDLRMQRYDYEHTFLDKYDYVINNYDLEDTVNQIKNIITKHKK